MSVIKCNAESCAHNSDCKCVRKHIDVCTSSGRDYSLVFCGTYKMRRREEMSELKNEIGRADEPFRDTCISCSAAGCVHNKDGACVADDISVTEPEGIKNRKCFCATFES